MSSPLSSPSRSRSQPSTTQGKDKDDKRHLKHAVAGALARCTEAIIMFPIDTVKTRLQFQQKNSLSHKNYNGVFDALKVIIKEEGLRGMNRGLPIKLAYIVPASGISFLCYEEVARVFHSIPAPGPNTTGGRYWDMTVPVLGLLCARTIGSVCRTPFDLLKSRLQVQGALRKDYRKYSNSRQALIYMYQTEGVGKLFKYANAALLRDVNFTMLYFSTYETAKTLQKNWLYKRGREISAVNNLISGGLAGSLATTFTIPFDVVKTRLQTQGALPLNEQKYKGVISAFKKIYQEEGWRAFTRGLLAKYLYIAPASAIVFATYEQYKKILDGAFPS